MVSLRGETLRPFANIPPSPIAILSNKRPYVRRASKSEHTFCTCRSDRVHTICTTVDTIDYHLATTLESPVDAEDFFPQRPESWKKCIKYSWPTRRPSPRAFTSFPVCWIVNTKLCSHVTTTMQPAFRNEPRTFKAPVSSSGQREMG